MPLLARGEVIDPGEVQMLHCVKRFVRRAFLCVDDSVTGLSFEHRRGWMSPIEINEREDAIGPDPESRNRRASRKGFLSISLTAYLELLAWTGCGTIHRVAFPMSIVVAQSGVKCWESNLPRVYP